MVQNVGCICPLAFKGIDFTTGILLDLFQGTCANGRLGMGLCSKGNLKMGGAPLGFPLKPFEKDTLSQRHTEYAVGKKFVLLTR